MQELHASIRTQLAVQAADLRALAHRLTSGPEAEDCVQNTMVAALSQHEPPRKLRPWLRRVLRNEIHAHHRVGTRRRHREHHGAVSEPTPTLDDRAEREQIALALTMVLDALEEPYRSTLRRRFLLEHPATVIARDEGCSPATVRWRVHEGLRRMRRMLDERFEGRQQWLGGMALLAGGPVEGATPATGDGATTTMTQATITTGKTLLTLAVAGTALAAITVLATSTVEATPVSPREQSAAQAVAAAMPTSPPDVRPMLVNDAAEVDADAPCQGDACESIDESSLDDESGLEFGGGNTRSDAWRQALLDCQAELDPTGTWERIELDLRIVGDESGAPLVERIEATTGREIPCFDPVDDPSPADAEGVQHHPELAACMTTALEMDPQMLGSLTPGEARDSIAVFVNQAGKTPSPGSSLPEPDAALAQTEPERAPAVLKLPQRGSTDDDAIAVVECFDYDCPFCRRSQAVVDQLIDQHPQVSFHVLANPLAMHPNATLAARAALAAGEQGEFWAMHDALFADLELRSVETLVAKAAELGLDGERFERDLLSDALGRRVATQAAVCTNAGARGTPSFFVGGDLVVGARGYEALAESVEFELSQRP